MSYGKDLGGALDLTPDMLETDGRSTLINAIARRLTTPGGTVFYDYDLGSDLEGLIKSAKRDELIKRSITNECLKDERVLEAQVILESVGTTRRIRVRILPQDPNEAFDLTLTVSDAEGVLVV